MGLATRASTPMAYSHSNSLVENTVGRARALAGSLMFALSEKIGIQFSTNNAWWSWVLRHACWILNRFVTTKAMTAYEVAFGKPYEGTLCEFGEPVFGYAKSSVKTQAKASARWKRMLFVGKIEPQDSYLLYDGHMLVLARSVRRISTSWKGHLSFYLNFACWSWNYKSAYGGRVIPVKTQRSPIGASFDPPQGAIEASEFFDEEAEQVKQKYLEEQKEEEELVEMAMHDKPALKSLEEEKNPKSVSFGETIEVDEEQPKTPPFQEERKSFFEERASSSSAAASVPVTSVFDDVDVVPSTPRGSPTTRAHASGEEEGHDSKRARLGSAKKQRVERIMAEHELSVRAVRISDGEVVHTMDSYEHDLQLSDQDELNVWEGESMVTTADMPEELCADGDPKHPPPEPDQHIDRLADDVELRRLCDMGVLVKAMDFGGQVDDKLTTKFVYDWRLREYTTSDGKVCKRWLRRSRLVAREYAFLERRDDTYSPATSTHILNLLPLWYLLKISEVDKDSKADTTAYTLASLDVKDAFLMVPQEKAVRVKLRGEDFIVQRNLPGQRLGARHWYLFLRQFLESEMDFKFCKEQPCLCRNEHEMMMIHVDDVMFAGETQYWKDVVLKKFQERFTISFEELGDTGTSISFLKRKINKIDKGIALISGTSAMKVVKAFEEHFGKARTQFVPCDQSMLAEDLSDSLSARDAFAFRSIIGICLYLARDRPDVLYSVKELSSYMSKPTHGALQKLKKFVGYLRGTEEYCMVLETPLPGQGKWKTSTKCWVLESFSDSDWSCNQQHRRSTSCGVHLLGGAFVYGSSRTQRVVSLSSCESELHALTSTLADSLFIKHCMQFLTNADIEQYLYTDSSSARQLSMKQGVGKAKHIAGKLLWIQDAVQSKETNLAQIPTAWNVSDIGTKPLSAKRLRLLLHEVGVATGEGDFAVGSEEFEQQSTKHGGARELAALAKTVSRVMLMMGLGPTGATAVFLGDESLQENQCERKEPNTMEAAGAQHGFNMEVFLLVFAALVWSFFIWRLYKWLWKVDENHNQLCLQVAELDQYAGDDSKRLQPVTKNSSRTQGEVLWNWNNNK